MKKYEEMDIIKKSPIIPQEKKLLFLYFIMDLTYIYTHKFCFYKNVIMIFIDFKTFFPFKIF